jgi:ABC-type microcin C transport system duplicated ATPase subunit YejF
MKLIQFDRHRFPENGTTEVGDITSKHGAVVNLVQHSGDGREVFRLQCLSILKQSQRITSEIAYTSSNAYAK